MKPNESYLPLVERWAHFSPCKTYRYLLGRRWAAGGVLCNFIMLNPSTADEVNNDPTVERCERRARAMGYPGLIVTNLFALRSTDPRVLKGAADSVGPENNEHLFRAAVSAGLVVCAWGNHGSLRGRAEAVIKHLLDAPIRLHALRISKAGQPEHPLYLPYGLQPALWKERP